MAGKSLDRYSASELAIALQQNERTFQRILKASQLPSAGGYEILPACAAILTYFTTRAEKSDATMEEAKKRKALAEADKAEIEVARVTGELAYISDVEAILKDAFAQIRTMIESAEYIPISDRHQLAKEFLKIRLDPVPNANGKEE